MPAGYPLPPTSGAPTPGAPSYPLPPSSGPPGYPLPPSAGPPGYPLPPSSGPPGYPGGPRPPKKKSKTGLIIGLVSALLVVACCATGVWSLSKGDPSRTGADPAPSVDRASPPPVVTALEPVLISVADIMSVMKPEASNYVNPRSSNDALQGGLTKLQLCSDPAVRGDAIGAQSNNGYWVSIQGDPSVGSAVAGFYGTAAKPFFDATRRAAERCGWQPFTVPELGQESFGIFTTDSSQVYAIVFAYSGQVLMQVAIKASNARGSYQSDVVKLATLMAKRLPQAQAKR
jgi:hypothetical protein